MVKIKHLLTFIVVVLLGHFVYKNIEDFYIIKDLAVLMFIIIIALHMIILYLNAYIQRLLFSLFHIDIKDSLHLMATNAFLNMVMPFRGGAGFRAFFMKKIYNLEYKKFASLTYANYLLLIFFTSILGLFLAMNLGSLALFILCLLALLSCVLVSTINIRLPFKSRFNDIFKAIANDWKILSKHPEVVRGLIICNILALAVYTGINFFAIKSLGLNAGLTESALLTVAGNFSFFFQITPAGLGIMEGAYYLSSSMTELEGSQAVILALIVRLAAIFIAIPYGGYSYFSLTNKLEKSLNQDEKE